jgi:hypothetical protein
MGCDNRAWSCTIKGGRHQPWLGGDDDPPELLVVCVWQPASCALSCVLRLYRAASRQVLRLRKHGEGDELTRNRYRVVAERSQTETELARGRARANQRLSMSSRGIEGSALIAAGGQRGIM